MSTANIVADQLIEAADVFVIEEHLRDSLPGATFGQFLLEGAFPVSDTSFPKTKFLVLAGSANQ